MPTSSSSSTARVTAPAWFSLRCVSSTSVSWRSTVRTGFSEVIGSWKIIAIRLPRISRTASSLSPRISSPSKMISPVGIRAAGFGSRRMSASELTLLPQPDSPTTPSVSPRSRS